MTDRDIKLYGYATSPYVMKVAVYLHYKGVPFEFVHVRPRTNEAIKFTGQTQVPVLEIDGEWRKDSSPLGHWIDELYPEKPLLPADPSARDTVLAIDDWVSDKLIPARFMEALKWSNPINSIRSGWRLAQIVNGGTPIPALWRWMWPFAISKAPFIVAMQKHFPEDQSIQSIRQEIIDGFLERLADGPYLGGLDTPSLADLSAYPIFISGWRMGLHGAYEWKKQPKILDWMKRVQAHLPDNPLPCDDRFIVRPYPF